MRLSEEILNIIIKVTSQKKMSLHDPIFFKNEIKYLMNCIDAKMVSSIGDYVDKFENHLCKFTGAKYAVAVVNGTSALHLALVVSHLKSNDEVLIPALNFVASASAIVNAGGIPHFIDSSEENLGIDPILLRKYLQKISVIKNKKCFNKKTGRRIHSIIPTHIFGHPCNIKDIKKIAKDYNLFLIEDAAEALGSYYKGKHAGNWGSMGILSFNGNKTITTGGGGAIITNNKELAKKAKHLSTTAKLKHKWAYIHDDFGFNYRMPSLNAAIGCAQMENISFILSNKRKLFNIYKKVFVKLDGVKIFSEPKDCKSNYWLQTLIFDKKQINERNNFLKKSNSLGVQSRPVWNLISKLPKYKKFPKSSLKTSLSLEKRIVNIPSNILIK